MKLFKILVSLQSIYIMLTALWPIIDIETFMAATGPKHDVWLVKTVGALLIPVASCLATFLFVRGSITPAIVLGLLTSVSFIVIDFYYALTDVISNIYMLDGVIESGFLAGWLIVIIKRGVPEKARHH